MYFLTNLATKILVTFLFPLQILCFVITALLHYVLLAAFTWMLIEGINLYLMLVKVVGASLKIYLCYLAAYGKHYKTI